MNCTPFSVESFSEKNVILEGTVHNPSLLRNVGKCAIDGHVALFDLHLTQKGRKKRRFTRPNRAADPNQTTLQGVRDI